MLKERREATRRVAQSLIAAEAAIDLALAEVAALNAALPTARADANLSPLFGQDALDCSIKALVHLGRARKQMGNTHRHLDATKTQIGLRELNVGDITEKPPRPMAEGQERHMRVVA